MEIEWLVTSVTAVGSSIRVRIDFLDDFWHLPIQAAIMVEEPFCDI